jgi:1-acyl-sn-glycerol-3-phosphate acyltransferase
MRLRLIRRAVALGLVLVSSILRFWLIRLRGPLTHEQRAHWVQSTCVRVLRSMEIHCEVEGAVPAQGLVVSNHLSYLDILILSAAMPCFFVAKAEIDAWPYFGKAARVGGTIFIDRSSLASAERVTAEVAERLRLPIPVLFFPEGTSTDGTMQPFHSRLFQPAIKAGMPITAASIRYVSDDGTPERAFCWFGDDTFAPHLLKTLQSPGFHARLHFGAPRVYSHRRIAARETSAEIAARRGGEIQRESAEVLQPA